MKYFRNASFSLVFLILVGLSAFQLSNPVFAQNEKPAEIKINPQTFDVYVGQYQDARDAEFIFSFFREGDKYYLQPTDQRKVEIFPSAENKFFLKDFDAQVSFVRDAGGKVVSIIWRQEGKDYPAKKISDKPDVWTHFIRRPRDRVLAYGPTLPNNSGLS